MSAGLLDRETFVRLGLFLISFFQRKTTILYIAEGSLLFLPITVKYQDYLLFLECELSIGIL